MNLSWVKAVAGITFTGRLKQAALRALNRACAYASDGNLEEFLVNLSILFSILFPTFKRYSRQSGKGNSVPLSH